MKKKLTKKEALNLPTTNWQDSLTIEHEFPHTKKDAIKFARKEIREWFKFLKKLQIQTYCPCCNTDLPIKLPKSWGKLNG